MPVNCVCVRELVCQCVCDVVGEAVVVDLTGPQAGLCFHSASSLSATEMDKSGDSVCDVDSPLCTHMHESMHRSI